MITEYHRPENLTDVLALLTRPGMKTYPLGGGTVLTQASVERFAVVDLQDLGLNRIEKHGKDLEVGAAVTLQAFLEYAGLQPALTRATRLEATANLRRVATLAGTLVAASGRSPLVTALLALDATLTILPGSEKVSLGELLLQRGPGLSGRLITGISLPLNARLSYESIARTPADQPIICAAVAQWPSGRTRAALGGFGPAPRLALDGPESGGIESATRNAASQAGDAWASVDYRQEMAVVLVRRCMEDLWG